MNKLVDYSVIKPYMKNGITVMIGGFMNCGTPETLVEMLLESGASELTVIANDTAFENKGIGKLVSNRRIKKLVVSHIGTNPETGRMMTSGEIAVELVPQGTLVERIRAGGAGLGGILTPTGVGTIMGENKQTIVIENRHYLLELPIKADLALICGSRVDEDGNIFYRGTSQNFNPMMAMAAKTVIAEAAEYVSRGGIMPEMVITPGTLVDYIVKGALCSDR